MKKLLLVSCGLGLLALSSSVFAEEAKRTNPFGLLAEPSDQSGKMTETSIRSMTDALNNAHKKTYTEFKLMFERHFADDLEFNNTDTSYTPGMSPITKTDVIGKDAYTKDLSQVYELLKGGSLKNQVFDVKIAADGKSGEYKDKTQIDGILTRPNKSLKILVKSNSDCINFVRLNDAGIIQIYKSDCTSETHITPQQ